MKPSDRRSLKVCYIKLQKLPNPNPQIHNEKEGETICTRREICGDNHDHILFDKEKWSKPNIKIKNRKQVAQKKISSKMKKSKLSANKELNKSCEKGSKKTKKVKKSRKGTTSVPRLVQLGNLSVSSDKNYWTNMLSPTIDPIVLPWYESEWHRCQICYKVYSHGHFAQYHIKSAHNMTSSQYFNQLPEAYITLPNWTCHICNKVFKWTGINISKHLHKSHRMSKDNYRKQFSKRVHK